MDNLDLEHCSALVDFLESENGFLSRNRLQGFQKSESTDHANSAWSVEAATRREAIYMIVYIMYSICDVVAQVERRHSYLSNLSYVLDYVYPGGII